MSVITQQIIHINANNDLSVSILDKINSCGCISSGRLSLQLNIPLEQLKNTLARIAEKNELKCDDNFEICCSDNSTFDEFVNQLNKLRLL